MNHWIGFGIVGKKPEIKILESGKKVAKFSFATNKSYTNSAGEKITETAWHNVLMWSKLADLCEKYVDKGSSLIIEGEIVYRSYQNKEGQIVYITEIMGNALHFTGSKKEEEKPAKTSTAMSDVSELGDIKDSAENDPSYDPFA